MTAQENKTMHLDVEEILTHKMPNKRLPSFIINYLKKIIHQEELNRFFEQTKGAEGLDFMEAAIYKHLQADADFEGLENLPPADGKYIFVSNHPLGGLDSIIIGLMLGRHYDGKVKFYANDILMFLEPMKDMFIPINKTGQQSRENLQIINDFYLSDNHLITFPAGTCSRKIKGKITDLEWKKNFVVKALEHQRDVVPIYFEGKNSNFFYNLSNIRTKLGLPNIEMLYLVREMHKQRGNHFTVKVGKTIPYQTFSKEKRPIEWAAWVREKVYKMV